MWELISLGCVHNLLWLLHLPLIWRATSGKIGFSVLISSIVAWTFWSGVSGKSCRCKQFCVIQYLWLKKALCSRYRSLCPQRSLCPSESLSSPLLSSLYPLLICEFRWRGFPPLALLLNHAKELQTSEAFFMAGCNCVCVCTRMCVFIWVSRLWIHHFDLREAAKNGKRNNVIIWKKKRSCSLESMVSKSSSTYTLLCCTKSFNSFWFHF